MLDDGLITYRSQLTADATTTMTRRSKTAEWWGREEKEEGSSLLLARTIQYTVLWYRHSRSTSLAVVHVQVQPVRAAGGEGSEDAARGPRGRGRCCAAAAALHFTSFGSPEQQVHDLGRLAVAVAVILPLPPAPPRRLPPGPGRRVARQRAQGGQLWPPAAGALLAPVGHGRRC